MQAKTENVRMQSTAGTPESPRWTSDGRFASLQLPQRERRTVGAAELGPGMMRWVAAAVLIATCLASPTSAQTDAVDRAPRTRQDSAADQTSDEQQRIQALLEAQVQCWNRGDIDGFMETYWKSEKLTFSGGGKTTRGWTATRDRYKARYPRDKMGTLKFDQLETSLLSDGVALVLGRWYLDQQGPQVEGNFTLVLKKFDDGWKIVHDHSSTLEQ